MMTKFLSSLKNSSICELLHELYDPVDPLA